jgi:beta-N-acetylhexosaminidase
VTTTRRLRAALVALVVIGLVAGCIPSGVAGSTSPSSPAPSPASSAATTAPTSPPAHVPATPRPTPEVHGLPPLSRLVGQKLIVAMDGPTATPAMLARIQRGEVGGVILFGRNITTAAALKALTKELQAAAATGGQPRLLLAVDQEGGAIKRIPWAPPTRSPPQMGTDGRASVARAQGASTATALKGLGITVDLAPVADVPATTSSFLYQQGRTFSFDAAVTTRLANAFADGLRSGGVLPTMKHFPGLGLATKNTDTSVVTIGASKAALDDGLEPYRTAIADGLPIVMLSNATYPAYDPDNAAGWSRAIGTGLLRGSLGFRGVTMTDSLDGTAHARGVTSASLALRAATAGTDLLLLTGTEASSSAVYTALLGAARSGSIPRSTLVASYERIEALKAAG